MTVTLTSGMRSNLYQLQNTAKMMDATAKRLSSGKKVDSALDDPINFFAAQNHTQRANDLESRKDEMSESIQTIKAADNGISAATKLIAQAKSLAQSALATEDTTERQDLANEYNETISQLQLVVQDSDYKGTNLLQTSDVIEVTFDESGDSKLTVAGVDGTGGLNGTTATNGGSGTWATDDDINTDIGLLDDARDSLRTDSKTLSNQLSTITVRQDFTTKMVNTLRDGSANLTNADLNEEGANMLMLQTQQSLGTSALSMSSQAAQAVLRLF